MGIFALILATAATAQQPGLPPFAFGPIFSLADPAPNQPEIKARYTEIYKRCLAQLNLDTPTQDRCNGQEMARQDARLNAVWRQVFARIGNARQPALRSAERAWIAGRKQHCELEAKEGGGGTIETLLYSSCMIDETIRRTIWLEALR